MDGVWLKAQKRIDDFIAKRQRLAQKRINDIDAIQQRLTQRWNALRKLVTETLPQKLIALLKSRSVIVLQHLTANLDQTMLRIERHWEKTKVNASKMSDIAILRLQKRWQELQPRLDNFVQTSFAISTATSTLQLTVQITPILLSALTVLATIPMLNALLPEILLNSTVLFFIMMGISACVGYGKFKELETRAKLDGQIEIHEKATKKHHQELRQLKRRLKECERMLGMSTGKSYLPLSEKKSDVIKQDLRSNPIDAPSTSSNDEDIDYRQVSPVKR